MKTRFAAFAGTVRRIVRLWCFLHGHDWVSVRADNGRSILMRHECARCEAYRDMQYDYNL